MRHTRQPSASSSQEAEDSTLLDGADCGYSTDRSCVGSSLHAGLNDQLRINELLAEFGGNIASPERPKIRSIFPSNLKHYDHNDIM